MLPEKPNYRNNPLRVLLISKESPGKQVGRTREGGISVGGPLDNYIGQKNRPHQMGVPPRGDLETSEKMRRKDISLQSNIVNSKECANVPAKMLYYDARNKWGG